ARERVLRHTTLVSKASAYVAVWAVLAFLAGLLFFLLSSRTIVLASHDAVLRPTLSGAVVVHTGPVLPDFRRDSGGPIGVDIRLGKTEAGSTEELVQRYAYIASQPEGQIAKVRDALVSMALAAALRGAVVGLVPILVWLLLGAGRRRELLARARSPGGALATGLVVLLAVALWQPWDPDEDTVESTRAWQSLADFLGPEVNLPAEAAGIEVRGDVTTTQTQRLIASAIDTYDKSKTFYATAAEKAADLTLRTPEQGDTVVLLVSDRHDNIGMDAVARAVGDAGGATAVFDAGDDTSAGQSWEAFSLDSLTTNFDDLDRWAIAGNHDHGSFVTGYLADHGWTTLDGTVVDGPAGTRLLGVDDPRSSGLGSWRDETGLSFDEVATRLADAACAAQDDGDRVTTLLVHDANLGRETLDRGCADLVLAGHLHLQSGPTRVMGASQQAGYSYTNGTTGGAAYAIAVGSKPKREAEVTLVTYRDGRPVGLQPVTLQTNGVFEVADYVPLHLTQATPEAQK
ncbi:MAG: metallophosphoesterase, partial [Nocardioides sp.]|nr:metallophosphoesterase [Nocardioides sp.]